jgi:hypothetical protein
MFTIYMNEIFGRLCHVRSDRVQNERVQPSSLNPQPSIFINRIALLSMLHSVWPSNQYEQWPQ